MLSSSSKAYDKLGGPGTYSLACVFDLMYCIAYSGIFSNSLNFKNFESSQAFSKIFFRINKLIMYIHFQKIL